MKPVSGRKKASAHNNHRIFGRTLHEYRLLLVIPFSKPNPFRQGVNMTISIARDKACAVKSLRNLLERFPQSHYHPLYFTSAGHSTVYVTMIRNFKRESLLSDTKDIIQVTRLKEEPQHLQDWPDYRRKGYNCLIDGSQPPTGCILTPPDLIHDALADIREHNLSQSIIALPPVSTHTRLSLILHLIRVSK